MFLYWNLSDLFLTIRLELRVWRRQPTEVTCHSHHLTVMAHAVDMIYHVDVDPDHLAGVPVPLPPFHSTSQRRKLLHVTHNDWRVMFHFPKDVAST